jgi:hypothetical protein
MKVFENRMLKRISGSKKPEGAVVWGKLHIKDHSVLYLIL